jgi:phage replication O-like protein O
VTDVQLEHGFTRLANRLLEALIAAPFTATQQKIVLAFWRDTYGWNEQAVRLSQGQVAERCGTDGRGGGFKRALAELLHEGVVVVVASNGDRQPSTYRVQKDFTLWGRFSIAEGRLAAVWDRPDHVTVEKPPAPPAEPKPAKRKEAPNYVARAVEIWAEERDGGVVDFGPVGQHLKPVVVTLGEQEALRRWQIYCRLTKGQTWANPSHFKANHGEYAAESKGRANAPRIPPATDFVR